MAEVDIFLKLDGVDGESKDDAHTNEIDIISFSHNINQAGSMGRAGGGGVGKVSVGELNLVAEISKASPNLYINCCTGKHHASATLTVRKAGENPVEFVVIEMTNVIVTSYTTSGSGSYPIDEFSLNFEEIKVTYTEQNADGSAGAGIDQTFNVQKNVKV